MLIDAVIAVRKGNSRPSGPIHLTIDNAALDTDWETATGTGTYAGSFLFFVFFVTLINWSKFYCIQVISTILWFALGFALAALLSYKNLTSAVNGSFEELKGHERDGVDPSFQIFSRVVSVVVSNPSTQHLGHSVNITLRHLEVTLLKTKSHASIR